MRLLTRLAGHIAQGIAESSENRPVSGSPAEAACQIDHMRGLNIPQGICGLFARKSRLAYPDAMLRCRKTRPPDTLVPLCNWEVHDAASSASPPASPTAAAAAKA